MTSRPPSPSLPVSTRPVRLDPGPTGAALLHRGAYPGVGDDDWFVLTSGQHALNEKDRAPRTRDTVLQVAVVAVLVVGLVALVGSLVVRRLAEQQSVHDVAELTDVIAQSVVQPALTDAMADDSANNPANNPANNSAVATRVLDPLVTGGTLDSSLVRVKLWTPRGSIVYSDEKRLIGRTFALDDEARDAFTGRRIEADISNLGRPENQFERGQGKLLEVYRPVWTPSGKPLLLETYFRYDTVDDRADGLWRGFAGIMISSIVALLVLLSPVVAFLLRRTRRAHEQRQAMAQRALAASTEERRRIGASLHDGVVQQLVAASFDIAGQAERASARGESQHARALTAAASTVRGTIGGLRSLLVEIYPPGLGPAGLPSALHDLVATLDPGVAVHLDVDSDAAAQLSPAAQELVFRVAQECLRNVAKHSGAATVDVALGRNPSLGVRLDIVDDGRGFDPAHTSVRAETGHLGLRLITDAARASGAELAVASRPGHGTHYRMEVPTS